MPESAAVIADIGEKPALKSFATLSVLLAAAFAPSSTVAFADSTPGPVLSFAVSSYSTPCLRSAIAYASFPGALTRFSMAAVAARSAFIASSSSSVRCAADFPPA